MTANLEGLAQSPQGEEAGEKRALVIAAHPDDADFGAAGTVHLGPSKAGSSTTWSAPTAPKAATTNP